MMTPDPITYWGENSKISTESKFLLEWKNSDDFYDKIESIKEDTWWKIFSIPNISKWNLLEQLKRTWVRNVIPVNELNYEKTKEVLWEDYIKYDETYERLKDWLYITERKWKYEIEWSEYMHNLKLSKKKQ